MTKPMLIIDKSGITITPDGYNALLSYIQHCTNTLRTKVDAYHQELVEARGSLPDASTPEGQTLTRYQEEIDRAEELKRQIEEARREYHRAFWTNFKRWAEVLHRCRIEAGVDKIEDIYTLNMVATFVMQMLREENPYFSREKFITYINQN